MHRSVANIVAFTLTAGACFAEPLEFDIYLIDEGMPSTTDVEFNRKAGAILRDRLKEATVIVVSHHAATLEKFCRSAAVLRDGQLYMFDTLEEAKRMYDYKS